MKKMILGALLALTLPFSSHAAKGLGFYLGSPTSGVQYKHHDWRFSIGLDDFGLAIDKTFNLGSVTKNPDLNPLYTYLGGQYVDDAYDELGVRSGIGFQVPVSSFEFYGEVGPTLYVVEDVDIEIEGAMGFRLRF